MWIVLPNENLSSIALTSQIDPLSIDLIWNVDQEHIEEVIRHMVWLENDLHVVRLIGWNSSLTWNEYEWHLLLMILDSLNKAFQVEIDWERGHILNGEGLLSGLSLQDIPKVYETILGCDFDLRSHTNTLQEHTDHGVV